MRRHGSLLSAPRARTGATGGTASWPPLPMPPESAVRRQTTRAASRGAGTPSPIAIPRSRSGLRSGSRPHTQRHETRTRSPACRDNCREHPSSATVQFPGGSGQTTSVCPSGTGCRTPSSRSMVVTSLPSKKRRGPRDALSTSMPAGSGSVSETPRRRATSHGIRSETPSAAPVKANARTWPGKGAATLTLAWPAASAVARRMVASSSTTTAPAVPSPRPVRTVIASSCRSGGTRRRRTGSVGGLP